MKLLNEIRKILEDGEMDYKTGFEMLNKVAEQVDENIIRLDKLEKEIRK